MLLFDRSYILGIDDVFLNHPFSSLAAKSEIMSAYSLYQSNEIKKAISKLKEFAKKGFNFFVEALGIDVVGTAKVGKISL